MTVRWSDYLTVESETFQQCQGEYSASFKWCRQTIAELFEERQPKTVACLGAGLLNDIPFDMFLSSDTSIYLVDWMQNSIDAGLAMSIIDHDRTGNPACLFCNPAIGCPQDYCVNFSKKDLSNQTVCDHFIASDSQPVKCNSYERGDLPHVRYEDVTGGYATAVSESGFRDLVSVKTWKHAFNKAIKISRRTNIVSTPLSIPDGEIEFVTSAMVVSQFEHEPYTFLSRCALDALGPPKPEEEEQLQSQLEDLRNRLFINQVERHCEEIARILSDDGICFMSFELFHKAENYGNWRLVSDVGQVLEVVGKYFQFDFDKFPSEKIVSEFCINGKPSLVCSLVLKLQ